MDPWSRCCARGLAITAAISLAGCVGTARVAPGEPPAPGGSAGPTISSFTAQPPTVAAGERTTLSWSTTDATSLSIDNGVGDVTGQASRIVVLSSTTSYTLTATNAVTSTRQSFTVVVTAQRPGTWVNVTPAQISLNGSDFGGANFGTQTIGLSTANPQIVYFGTCYQGIWKTTNSGELWTKVNTGANGDNLDSGRNWTLAVDPSDPNTLYTVAGYGGAQGIWKSTNGGVDWTQMMSQDLTSSTSADIYSIAIDPRDSQHLLVGFHSPWQGSGNAGVLESRDGGRTWIQHPSAGPWGAGHYVMFVDSATWILATQVAGLWRTTDSGGTWAQVSTENMQHGGEQLYQSSDGSLYIGSVQRLLRSTNRGVSWAAVQGLPSTPDGYNAVIGDGTFLYASPANTGSTSDGSQRPYYYSLESDGITWRAFNGQVFIDGPMSMAMDGPHQILFSSNWRAGVWRLVTGH